MLPFVVFSVYAWGNFMAFADEETPYYSWNKEFTRTQQETHYDVVILGDSVANASYVPELLSDTTVNLALGGMTPVENYYIFKDWLAHNEAPDYVFISFQDLHLNMSDCFWSRAMYMHRFDFKDNLEALRKAQEYGEETIAVDGWVSDLIEYELYLPTKYVTSLAKASVNQRLLKNTERKDKTDLHRGWYMGRSTAVHTDTEVQSQDEYVVDPIYDEYYRRILDLCEQNNITTNIIRLPLSEMTVFGSDYANQLNAYYEELCYDYEDVSFVWYAKPYEKEMFMDYVHMNMRGAFRFTSFLKEEFPECFEDSFSSRQILAINDSIFEESDITRWMGWIAGKDYTLLVCDEIGKADLLAEAAETYGLKMEPYEEQTNHSGDLYIISGMAQEGDGNPKNSEERFWLDMSQEEWKITVGSQEPTIWYPIKGEGMSVILVDHLNETVAVQRNFIYEEGFVAK